MKHIFTLFTSLLLLLVSGAHAQQWTWLTGGNTPNVLPNYLDDPGGRQKSSMWAGHDGILYLFGGDNFDSNFVFGDLWSFDTLSTEWTWIAGSSSPNSPGIYGVLGESQQGNQPGSRKDAASWVDSQGNLWLFGGVGYGVTSELGRLNDLWKYDPVVGLWTWISGSNQVNIYGNYGDTGVPSNTNMPGTRGESAHWIFNDELYLFGGNGQGDVSNGYLKDLWKYSISENQWVHLGGGGIADVAPNYGELNASSSTNHPGTRVGSCNWISSDGTKLYLFGGAGGAWGGVLNDLWQYDLSTNNWTWMGGTSTTGDLGSTGELGVPSINNRPAGRLQAVSFAQNNYLWLFGGYTNYYINDLWRYNITTGEWTWMGGEVNGGDLGAYLEQGPSSLPNYPSNKEGAQGCVSDNGKFWLFGGTGSVGGVMNDLWKLEVAPDAPMMTCNPLPANLQQGLVGYWPFCGNANDESGNGNDGVVNGASLTEDRFGNEGSAYRFYGGGNSFIQTPISNIANPGFTISAWAYSINATNFSSIVASRNGVDRITSINFHDGLYYMQLATNSTTDGCQAPTLLADSVWYLFTATYDNNIMKTYLNGQLMIECVAEEIPNITAAFKIGIDDLFFDGVHRGFSGIIDDIGIWNRALTANEITQLYGNLNPQVNGCTTPDACNYNALATLEDGSCTFAGDACDDGSAATTNDILGADCSCAGTVVSCTALEGSLQDGLVGWWPFCGNLHDESGNSLNGEYFTPEPSLPAVTLTQDRFLNDNAALSFPGAGMGVAIPAPANGTFSDAMSYSLWFKQDFINDYLCLLDPTYSGRICLIEPNSTSIMAYNGAGFFLSGNHPDLNTDTWKHLVVNYREGTITIYLNADLIGTLPTGSSFTFPDAQTLLGIYSGTIYSYRGLMDDIGIWNRALTPAEITSLYTGEPVVQPVCAELDPALQQGLVGYWPFCGNANDESGNGLNGQLVYDNVPTLTPDRFGITNSAYSVSAAGNGVILPAPAVGTFASGEMSYSIWYNEVVSNDFMHIFSAAGKPLLLGPNSSGISAYDGNSFYVGGLSTDLSVAGWKNIVTVYQQDTITIYINGIEAVSQTTGFDSPIPYLDAECIFGLSLGGMYPFLGQIDDAVLWNRALNAEEVALLYGNFTQPVIGCTDPSAFNYNPQANQNEGCLYTASVFVYNDLNGNGEHESNEPGLSNWPVVGNDINGLLWTNGNGNAFVAVPQGAYQFTVLNTTDNWVLTTEASGILSVGGNNCTDQNGNPVTCPSTTLSFGLQVIPGEAIVAAGPFTGFWDILHCTDGYESGVYLENIGSQTVSGFMTLTCDPLFTPNASSYFTTPPAETGPGYALWNVEDFLPGEYELLSFHIDGPGVEYLNQSFTFDFDITLFDPQGNIIYSDNWSVSPVVACAYDPNDITGFPEGLSAPHEEGYTIEHYILPDNMVEFRVRFQNTGTLPAEDIDIYIPIDPNQWELSTIFPLMRSAEMQVICLHDDGLNLSILEHELPEGVTAQDLLIFSFDDIYLPDSASNPDGSQGYVYFRMRAKHALNIGDEINAQAFIYFEQNPPITTNETYHLIFDCESFTPMVGDTELCAGEALQFSASQANVDVYAWSIGTLEGSGNIFLFEDIDAGEYTLELNTSNMLCPQGEDHQVNVIVHDIPQLDVPLDATVCEGEELTFEAESDGAITWSNGASTGDIIIAEEDITVTATAVGAGSCSASADWSVTVNPLPNAGLIDDVGTAIVIGGSAWQWYFNGEPIEGATLQSYTFENSGNYYVIASSDEGCSAQSATIVINNLFVHSWSTLHLYPNPMTTGARLELPQGTFDIALYDITGACIRTLPEQQGTVVIERESLASGVYQVRIVQGEQSKSLRLVVE